MNSNAGFSAGPFARQLTISPALPDGFIRCGEGGAATEESLAVVPYCDAAPGSLLSMRLFYWNRVGNDPDTMIWICIPLVEVLGIVSNTAGPSRLAGLTDNERLCDTLALVNGVLGLTGAIYSFGTPGPTGTQYSDLPAMVNVEIQGARLLSFEFQATDPNTLNAITDVNCNALWAKFS